MSIDLSVLKSDERAIFGLRSLYQKYGYAQYKMNKFEEYDLYVRNKDFLVSDNVITFTDISGKLMALKPDVTLSIIRNTKSGKDSVQKVYYNENVYRVPKGSSAYREIMQVGLECIGAVDNYNIFEVLMLAAESLKQISGDCVLDISHMDIVSGVIDSLSLPPQTSRQLLKCIGEKNAHGIAELCAAEGVEEKRTEQLRQLAMACGTPDRVLPKLEELFGGEYDKELEQLTQITNALESCGLRNMIRLDFSVVHDMTYYNGIVFRGFVEKIPTGILSGGQYNKLMRKMGHSAEAIGFAVYLDMLERLSDSSREYDVDTLILYDETADLNTLSEVIRSLTEQGVGVMAQRSVPEQLRCRQLLKLVGKEVEPVETNA